MAEFEGRKRRHQFDGRRSRHQFGGRRRTHTFDATAPSEVQEATATVIDDFEDGDIAEYSYATASFSVQTTVVQEGAAALRVDTGTNEHISSFPGDGLPYYPEAGDTFRWWGRTSNMSRFLLLYFGAQAGTGGPSDRPDGYAAFLFFANGELRLRKREANTNTTLASAAFDFSADVWYDVEVQWGDDGTITVRLLDEAGTELTSISATDTTFTSGGITWQTAGEQGPKYMDYARVPP